MFFLIDRRFTYPMGGLMEKKLIYCMFFMFTLIISNIYAGSFKDGFRNGGPFTDDIYTKALLHFDGNLENCSDQSEDALYDGDGYSYVDSHSPEFNECLMLDGNSHIYIPYTEHLSLYVWTIEMWFNLNSYTATLIDKEGYDEGTSNYNIHIESDGHMEARYYDCYGERHQINTPENTFEIGQWYHVSFILDYIDNYLLLILRDENYDMIFHESITTMDFPNPTTGNNDIIIGYELNGMLDELRISINNREVDSTLTANFWADTIAGENPLITNFIDSSVGDIIEWQWDFDNDGIIDSYQQNPTHVYSEPGLYSVKLTVSDSTETDIELKENYISVLPDAVAPLISDNWRTHHWPYNAYYPLCDNENHNHSIVNGHVACSCGPTAVSRLLHYWEYPIQGSGSFSFTDVYGCEYSADFGNTIYQWDDMPYELFDNDPESVYSATATLTYHVATCVNDVNVWGANVDMWIDGLTTYFNYKDTAQRADRNNFTRDEWIVLFKNELSHGRPILVVGESPEGSGHWFLCDGYNSANEFHFRLSWGGGGDGYYDIDSPYIFSEENSVLVGLEPDYNKIQAIFTADITEGNTPLTVNFTDHSNGYPTYWHWDFDNNGTTDSYMQNPTCTFNEAGLYTVSLTVGNNLSCHTKTVEDYILVNPTDVTDDIVIYETKLIGNYPNPFNISAGERSSSTAIAFTLAEDSQTKISIYNLKGQKVRSLINERVKAGYHEQLWNGCDDSNKPLSSGIYFYNLSVNGIFHSSEKCILLK